MTKAQNKQPLKYHYFSEKESTVIHLIKKAKVFE